MSIFKRNDQGSVQQTSAAPQTGTSGAKIAEAEKKGTPVAAAAAPGVVPPPAAPIYSTRLPSAMPVDTGTAMARRAAAPAAPQQRPPLSAQATSRAVQQAKTASSSATSVAKRPAQEATPVARRAAQPHTPQAFDAVRCAQAGLLNLAWSWQQAGSPIRAIHAYMELICRYPKTAAADAAVADLTELSSKLAHQGQFQTALAIYDQLEELM